MGQLVGSLIAQELSGESRKPEPFVYLHQGDLATIGRKSAVVSLGRIRLKGLLGWLFWSVVHIYFLIGLRNRIRSPSIGLGISHLPAGCAAHLVGVGPQRSRAPVLEKSRPPFAPLD